MDFDEVISDIEKMIGLGLKSIKKGSNLTLTGINKESRRAELISSDGEVNTRPFSELVKIWDGLCSSPAIHVESVLAGSGSRRNQPETIMANLPYVEWLIYENKKHLALVGERTHQYGTILQMNETRANEIRSKLMKLEKVYSDVIIITDNIESAALTIGRVMGRPANMISADKYELVNGNMRYFLVAISSLSVSAEIGTYHVVTGSINHDPANSLTMGQEKYNILRKNGLNLMVKSTIQ